MLSLPLAVETELREALAMIERRSLAGRGLQWSDMQLLAGAQLSSALLWTRHKRLATVAEEFGIGWIEAADLRTGDD